MAKDKYFFLVWLTWLYADKNPPVWYTRLGYLFAITVMVWPFAPLLLILFGAETYYI